MRLIRCRNIFPDGRGTLLCYRCAGQHISIREPFEQRIINYDVITAAVDSYGLTEHSSREKTHGQIFFFDGPGSTGKPFLFQTIIAYTGCQSKIVIAVAPNGIAALLLTGGRTFHSTFKLSLYLDANSSCNIHV